MIGIGELIYYDIVKQHNYILICYFNPKANHLHYVILVANTIL